MDENKILKCQKYYIFKIRDIVVIFVILDPMLGAWRKKRRRMIEGGY